jgi:hypothetical protein
MPRRQTESLFGAGLATTFWGHRRLLQRESKPCRRHIAYSYAVLHAREAGADAAARLRFHFASGAMFADVPLVDGAVELGLRGHGGMLLDRGAPGSLSKARMFAIGSTMSACSSRRKNRPRCRAR